MSKKVLAWVSVSLVLFLLVFFQLFSTMFPHTTLTAEEAQACLDHVFVSPVIGSAGDTAAFFLDADFPLHVCSFSVIATADDGKQIEILPDKTSKPDNTIKTDDWTFYSNLGEYQNVVLTMTISDWGRPIAARTVTLYTKS